MAQALKYLPALTLAHSTVVLLKCLMPQVEHLQVMAQAVHLMAHQRQAILTTGITRGQMRPTFIGVLDNKNNFKNKEDN